MRQDDLQFFHRGEDFSVFEQRSLPHWMQAGTLCFITWRLNDSLPREVLQRLDSKIDSLLQLHGFARNGDWAAELAARDLKTRSQIQWDLFLLRDQFLDEGWGRCPLRSPEHAKTVVNSLLHFNEQRYFLTDAVVMPNHAHFIAAFQSEDTMLSQCEQWKRFTGRTIHRAEGRSGEFWQVDQFDHLIRSEAQFAHFRQYISNNPAQANLREGEFLLYSKRLNE